MSIKRSNKYILEDNNSLFKRKKYIQYNNNFSLGTDSYTIINI